MLLAKHFDRLVAKVLTTRTEPSCVHIESDGLDFLNCVRECTNRDESIVWALKELGLGANLYGEEWEENNSLVLFRGKVYVPLDGKHILQSGCSLSNGPIENDKTPSRKA